MKEHFFKFKTNARNPESEPQTVAYRVSTQFHNFQLNKDNNSKRSDNSNSSVVGSDGNKTF